MTLRLRLAAITTALLAVVLAVAGVVLERLTARDMERSLENRAVERARGRAADASEPPPEEAEPPPPPPPPEGPDGRPEGDPGAPGAIEPERPAPSSMSSPLANEGSDASARRVLLPESDGAAVEIFQFQQPTAASLAGPALRAHLTNDAAKLSEADARARLSTKRAKFVERVEIGGVNWIVAQDFAPPADAGRRADPPPRMIGPRGDRRPPPPPTPRERRLISIAFVDAGPAARAHRTLVVEMGAIGVGALVLGGLLSYVLAGRMLRPVAAAARAAEAIEHPKARLPSSGTKDELGRLVAVLNGMLGRLEAASDRERLFLATASHELRRPLTALLGELELASAAGRSSDELRASIALARDDGKAMGRLVDDILHHAKAQAGTLPLVESDVALRELVADAVKRSRRSVQRPVEVHADAVPDWIVRADADLLRRALENLVVNAAVHGGDAVRVTVHGERDATGLLLHVEDDGPGVPADELRTIFDPFGRGDRARTVPGFGLGLAIARDVARAHGGDLTVLSPRPGADAARPGSRFTLRLAADRLGAADPGGSAPQP